MLALSAPVCSQPIHGQYQNRASYTSGAAKGYHASCILAMSRQQSESESHHHHSDEMPHLEPFSQNLITRRMKEPPLLIKAENAIKDRCSILEDDESFECWETLFEFKKMVKESEEQCNVSYLKNGSSGCQSLEEIEDLVRRSGGVKTLIDNINILSRISKLKKEAQTQEQISVSSLDTPANDAESSKSHVFPVPDDLPKSQEDFEEEEKAKMPDSPYTRMLRRLFTSSRYRNSAHGLN